MAGNPWRAPGWLRSRRGPAPRFRAIRRAWRGYPAPFHQQHLFHAVDLLELHFDDFDVGGLHHAADEARLDGQLAVAAVDQHQQLHARRPAVVEQRVERGADGAAGVQHVVHQDDVLALHAKTESRWR
jgi:hypothetical protein